MSVVFCWRHGVPERCLYRGRTRKLPVSCQAYPPLIVSLCVTTVNQFLTPPHRLENRSFLTPLQGEIEKCDHRVSFKKFYSGQFLFEAFFHIIGIFRSIEP